MLFLSTILRFEKANTHVIGRSPKNFKTVEILRATASDVGAALALHEGQPSSRSASEDRSSDKRATGVEEANYVKVDHTYDAPVDKAKKGTIILSLQRGDICLLHSNGERCLAAQMSWPHI